MNDAAKDPEPGAPEAPEPASRVGEVVTRVLATGVAGLILGLPATAFVIVYTFRRGRTGLLPLILVICELMVFVPSLVVPLPALLQRPRGRPLPPLGRDLLPSLVSGVMTALVSALAVAECSYGFFALIALARGEGLSTGMVKFSEAASATMADAAILENLSVALLGVVLSSAFLALLRRRGHGRLPQCVLSVVFVFPLAMVMGGVMACFPLLVDLPKYMRGYVSLGYLTGVWLALVLALGDGVHALAGRIRAKLAPGDTPGLGSTRDAG